jgi:hypothetical protein
MRANPGGILDVFDVVGRDEFIDHLWQTIERNSVRLEADRRVGKTSVLRKMCAQPPPGWEPVYLDVGKAHSTTEFAELFSAEVQARLHQWSRPSLRVADLLKSLGGIVTDGVFRPPDRQGRPEWYWKELLWATVADLVEQQATTRKRVVFFFDEMAWMLAAVAEREGGPRAGEVLDVLRALRQDWTTGQGFRMLLSGSIGMHHILRLVGEQSAPLNDMIKVELPPLTRANAKELAGRLLSAEGLIEDRDQVEQALQAVQAIADETAGYPYYIHWIVYRLAVERLPATPEQVQRVTHAALTDPRDPWDLRFYRSRIPQLYPRDGALPLVLLDTAAASDRPVPFADLQAAAERTGERDVEKVRDLLRFLLLDYYLTRDAEGSYAFRLPFLRRWWAHDRSLT